MHASLNIFMLTLRFVFSVLDIIVVFTVRYFLVNVWNSYVRWWDRM